MLLKVDCLPNAVGKQPPYPWFILEEMDVKLMMMMMMMMIIIIIVYFGNINFFHAQLYVGLDISSVTKSCFFHRRWNTPDKKLPQWIVSPNSVSSLSHLYWNSVVVNLPDSTLHLSPQCRTACQRIEPRDHITSALRQLHWLPIKAHITYKIYLMMFNRWVSLILLHFARPQCLAATHLSSPEVGNGLSWPKPPCTCNAMVKVK